MFKEAIEYANYMQVWDFFRIEEKSASLSVISIDGTDILFQLALDTNKPQELLYYNFVIDDNNGINITIHRRMGNIVCQNYVKSQDDLESTLFQFNTIVDMYDMDESYYSVLLEMRDIFRERRMKQEK